MKVVKPSDTTHTIYVIPRYYGFTDAVLTLSNLSKDINEVISHSSSVTNGILEIIFDYTFVEGDKFTMKLVEVDEVVNRSDIMATEQETQDFDVSKNYYTYG